MIRTGIRGLNSIIKGYKKEITMFYGGATTGKTTFCLVCALDLANKGERVLFIDTENGFSVERARQIRENFNYLMHNILVFKVNNFKQQKDFFDKLPKLVKEGNFSVLIVDTIGMHYRKALKEDSYSANKEIAKEFDFLKQISKKVPVIIANQIYSKMDGDISPVGGNMLKNFADCLIELRKNDHRILEIKKPIKEIANFEIIKEGIIFS